MFEKRNVQRDLVALALFALVLFLSLSLLTYHRSDPSLSRRSGVLVYPATGEIQNMCGQAGAWAADLTLRLLGIGAYFLVISLAVVDGFFLLRRPIDQPMVRFTGWLVALAGLATLAAMVVTDLLPSLWGGPEIGPGGVIGAVGSGLLLMYFATAGAYILIISVLIAGMVMCTDYVLFRFGIACLGTTSRVFLRVTNADRRLKRKSPADEEIEEEDEGLSIRFLGRGAKSKAAEEEVELDKADDSLVEEQPEDESADEEDVAAPIQIRKKGRGGRRRLAPAVKIKKRPKRSEREEVIESLEAASQNDSLENYELPDIDLLLPSEDIRYEFQEKEI
ncbi:MAG: DNA translocase FtsK 4TM domain-containing protein, partial [Planctomycetales bacterium]